jgi:hypothetical protein
VKKGRYMQERREGRREEGAEGKREVRGEDARA